MSESGTEAEKIRRVSTPPNLAMLLEAYAALIRDRIELHEDPSGNTTQEHYVEVVELVIELSDSLGKWLDGVKARVSN